MMTKMKRILLADDNPDLRSALALLVETRLHAEIICEVATMEALLAQTALFQPDIVILDWELPGQPKGERIGRVKRECPTVKVIVTSARPEAAAQAEEAGVDVFINRTDPPESIVEALRLVE